MGQNFSRGARRLINAKGGEVLWRAGNSDATAIRHRSNDVPQ
jgi:hypothetical protein